jgi:aldose 1-epimerase
MEALTLRAGGAVAVLAPRRGGGLVSLEAGGRPVLSARAGRPEGPFALALNLLLPFSNRLSRPFAFEGRSHAVPPNLPGAPLPIHGDAFQRVWEVAQAGADQARLRLLDGAIGPWAYEAEADWRLAPGALDVRLSLVSRAEGALPWGIGFHPWFPRDGATRLRFAATGWWPEGAGHLPATETPMPLPEGLGRGALVPPPGAWINAGFAGWDGEAEVVQGPGAVSCRLSAPGLATLLVYSPGPEAPFLCLEPVSHPVDAVNLPGQPGLVRLEPGGRLAAAMRLAWEDGLSPAS